MYKDFIHIFVLSCTKATFLIEKKLHTKLNIVERVQLHIHLSLCSHCSNYNIKAEVLDKLTKVSIQEHEVKAIFNTSEIESFKKKVCKKLNL